MFMKNGDVKNFQLNTSARPATATPAGDRSVRRPGRPSTPTSRSRPRRCRSSATAARCSSTPTSSTSRTGLTAGRAPGRPAPVLPKNVWQYVVADPAPRRRSARFVLQGGTQYNLAAVKAQVDYIESRFKGKGVTPRSSCTRTAAKRARSARRSKPVGSVGQRPRTARSSASTPCSRSSSGPRATKRRAATSARTSACARSSTSNGADDRPRTAVTAPAQDRPGSAAPTDEQRLIIAPARRARSRTSTTCARSRSGLDADQEGESRTWSRSRRRTPSRVPTVAARQSDAPARSSGSHRRRASATSAPRG